MKSIDARSRALQPGQRNEMRDLMELSPTDATPVRALKERAHWEWGATWS